MIVDPAILAIFVPTFFFVSVTPGMCMTLSMTLGMTIGVRRTLWMMWGELAGVALVSIAAVIGAASIMLHYPAVFAVFRYIGGAYLFYLGIQLWRSLGKMAFTEEQRVVQTNRVQLASQGFMTAIANPKGWAFMISLLPPFINSQKPMVPQLLVLLTIILITEFTCLTLYASGGRSLRRLLESRGNIKFLNRVAGSLMCGVGCWLIVG
jgi:homoserine/homoserine lactone efflux protein